jgi:hypothetical protein
VSIPVDTYFIVTPGSEFLSKSYGTLSGTDLFFYVTETNSLRVVNMTSTATAANPGTTAYVLAQDVKWVGVVTMPGVCYVYYTDTSGQMWYIQYRLFGGPATASTIPIGSVVTFSVTHTSQSNPPAFMIMTDDGIHHNLFAATDPGFQAIISTTQTYNNSFNTAIYVVRPTIAMHPLDTQNLTVHCQQITVLGDVSETGFYVVKVPGLN